MYAHINWLLTQEENEQVLTKATRRRRNNKSAVTINQLMGGTRKSED